MAHPVGCRGEPAQEAADRDLLQSDEVRPKPYVSDALVDVRPGATADAAPPHPLGLADAGAEKSVAQGPVVPVQVVSFRWESLLQAQPDAAAEPYTQDAARSAEQSCVAQAVGEVQRLLSALPAVQQRTSGLGQMRPQAAELAERAERQLRAAALQDAQGRLQVAAEQPAQRAFLQSEVRQQFEPVARRELVLPRVPSARASRAQPALAPQAQPQASAQ